MAIELLTYARKTITPQYDAIIQDACVGRSGIFYGCGISSTASNSLTVESGYGAIKGRLFKITATDLNITLSTSGTLYGVVFIRLDLSNTEGPVTIEYITQSSGYYSVSQDEEANFTNGVYEMELCRFKVNTSTISEFWSTALQIPYNAMQFYTLISDFGYGESGGYAYGLYEAMQNRSIGMLSCSALIDPPYSGASGMVLFIRYAANNGKIIFIPTSETMPKYEMRVSSSQVYEWSRIPSHADMYYEDNNMDRLYVNTSGYLTSGKTKIWFFVPSIKITSVLSAAESENCTLTVRQNGTTLLDTGCVDIDFDSIEIVPRSNGFSVGITKSSGFGGTNNAECNVSGWIDMNMTTG